MKAVAARSRRAPRAEPRRLAGEESEDLRRFHRFVEDRVWVDEHREELRTRYPEQWIAVVNKRVIASDPDFHTLLARVPDSSHTCIERVTRDEVEIAL